MSIKEALTFIEGRLGLHERFDVLYVVDGYEATFYGRDGDTVIAAARSESMEDSITDLADLMYHASPRTPPVVDRG